MLEGRRILGLITARGGSKGIPRKNLVDLVGKPLIAWSIEAGLASCIDRLVVSTEDEEIAQVAKQWGCEVPFMRPMELAADDTPGMAPVLHAVELLAEGFDYVVLLQPTSPLRRPEDIDGCVAECVHSGAPACVSLKAAEHGPHWMYELDSGSRLVPFIKGDVIERRQDLPQAYALNGAVYVAEPGFLLECRTFLTSDTVGYVMPSARSLDIDEPLDLLIARALIEAGA